MKSFEEDLKEYYENKRVVEISPQKMEQLRALTELNKENRKINIFRKVTAFASAFCMLLLIIIPTVVFLSKKDTPPTELPTIYYGDAEAIKKPLEDSEVQAIISSDYPKYNFIFDEFTFTDKVGFYVPNEDKLLAIQLKAKEKNAPYTEIEINLVISNQFIFNEKEGYTKNAIISQTDNYELHKVTNNSLINKYIKGYFKYNNYEFYLYLKNSNNDTLFNKFA